MSAQPVGFKSFSSYAVKSLIATPPPSSQTRIDTAIERLHEGARRFARLSIQERIDLAMAMQRGVLRVAEKSVAAGCRAKSIALGSTLEAEEWATGPWGVVRQLRQIRQQLAAVRDRGNTQIGKVSRTIDGGLAVNVFPSNGIDKLLFNDVSVDVHMLPSVTESRLSESRASYYKAEHTDSRVVLALAAGNIAAIAPMDVITKMFNEGAVCLLKVNPVNAYLGPFIEEAFADAIQANYLAAIYGGVEEGAYAVNHDGIDEIHVTGSDKTHDAIVWGSPGPERDERMKRKVPLLAKRITSELGNISPILLVPGPYTDAELRFQAEDAASYFVMNASFLCNAAKMLVLPQQWDGSDKFRRGIEAVCESVPPRQAYYPGAEERWRTLTQGRGNVKTIGGERPGALPWTLIGDLDPKSATEPLFLLEPFCSILSETRLGSADPIEFLTEAVDFCNNRLWGTLSATIVVHPQSMQDAHIAQAVEQAIIKLKYGSIGVNGFAGMSFVLASPPWGAYPGATLDDIQSGSGFVHNTPMLEGIEKAVIRFPLTSFPKPGYFPSHRTTHKLMRSMVRMEENASWSKIPGMVFNAMRG